MRLMILLVCSMPFFSFADESLRWHVQTPRIERTVQVRSLAEAQEAVKQAGTKVVLEADIDAAGEDGVVLTTHDILIDGNGKTISNARRGVASGNEVLQRIEIRNLTLKDCGYGLFLRRDQHVHIHHNTVTGSRSHGMHFENSFGNHGRFFEVHDNKVTGGRNGCIVFQDGCTDGRVYNNTCRDGGFGPQSYANGCLNFDSNIIRVEIYGNHIEGGTFGLALRGQNNEGMHDCKIHHNIVTKTQRAGMRIAYHTFGNVLLDNKVSDCPVAVCYQRAYKVSDNMLDGITVENCPLAVQIEGASTAPLKEGQKPEPAMDGNVDRLVLKDWKAGAPVVTVRSGVKVYTLADAGTWYDGAVMVQGEARIIWASFAHVLVMDGDKPAAGAVIVCGEHKAISGEDGTARLGPFPAREVTQDGAKDVARPHTLNATFSGKQATATFTPDGGAHSVLLTLE